MYIGKVAMPELFASLTERWIMFLSGDVLWFCLFETTHDWRMRMAITVHIFCMSRLRSDFFIKLKLLEKAILI